MPAAQTGGQPRSVAARLWLGFCFIRNEPFSSGLEPAQTRGVPAGLEDEGPGRGGCARQGWEGSALMTLHTARVGGGSPGPSPRHPIQAPTWDRGCSAATCWAGTAGKVLAAGSGLCWESLGNGPGSWVPSPRAGDPLQVPPRVLLHWDHHLGSSRSLGRFVVWSSPKRGLAPGTQPAPTLWKPQPQLLCPLSCSSAAGSSQRLGAGRAVGCGHGARAWGCEHGPGRALGGSF